VHLGDVHAKARQEPCDLVPDCSWSNEAGTPSSRRLIQLEQFILPCPELLQVVLKIVERLVIAANRRLKLLTRQVDDFRYDSTDFGFEGPSLKCGLLISGNSEVNMGRFWLDGSATVKATTPLRARVFVHMRKPTPNEILAERRTSARRGR
jgi:hypothetical protein